MKKIIILIPVYNDWESLKKLLVEINNNIKEIKNVIIECLIINDASTIEQPKLRKPKKIKTIKILNMIENRGHARCNAFAIRYAHMNEKFNHLILMDGDGEDRPAEIKSLIKKAIENPKNSVVAKRIKRSEGPIFKFLYIMHKLITRLFTGKNINFGNYSCLTFKDVRLLSTKAALWSSYSGTVKKNLMNLKEIDSIRGTRYYGPSKMSLYKLLIHSFSIIAVYKYQVMIRAILFIFVLILLKSTLGSISNILQILIICFTFIIFLISRRENQEELINSQENLGSIKEVKN